MLRVNQQKHFRLAVIAIAGAMGIAGCTTVSPQSVPVESAGSSTGSNSGAPRSVQSLNQVNALQAEVRELRNQLEEQQFEFENLRQRQQDLFQGLDQRLRVAEAMQQGGTLMADGSVVNAGGLPPLGAAGVATGAAVVATGPGAASDVTTNGNVPTVAAVSPAPPSAGVDQQALYDQGFDHLKQSRYTEAIDLFSQLVNQFPDGGLADDASYWIGEANYVNRQYESAIRAFRKVVAQYPQSDRVPEALLKVGYVQYDIGDYQNAKVTFQDVLRRYPDHPVAISAKSRMERIERGVSG